MMGYEDLWKKGMIGKVVYDENEDSYRLEQKVMGFGLCEPLWQSFEGKKVRITIEIIEPKPCAKCKGNGEYYDEEYGHEFDCEPCNGSGRI